MPARLELDDLETPLEMRSCRARRCLSPSYRGYNSPLCSPCPPRCYSTSPSARRRRSTSRCLVPQRDLKSGRMVCDTFASVCYPRNLGNCCSTPGDGFCTPRMCRKPPSCTPSCYRSCSPRICPRGICRSSCRCPSPSAVSSYCAPCSPCDNLCEPGDPSDKFVQAMKSTGSCTRYQTHLCPWEADVTVSGTIRAHCTSTADEISNRLAGPFKAFGKRFTTDAESNWANCEPCDQKLSLGILDDGGALDFSRNNRPSSDGSNMDYRIRRIMDRAKTSNRYRSSNKPLSGRDNHISWDTSLDYNDSHDDSTRYSKKLGCNNLPSSRTRPKSNNYHREEGGRGNLRRFGKDNRSFGDRTRRRDDSCEVDGRLNSGTLRDDDGGDRLFVNRKLDGGCRAGGRRSRRDKSPTFEIMMNRRRLSNNSSNSRRRYSHTPTGRCRDKFPSESECEDRRKSRRDSFYCSGDDADDEDVLATRQRQVHRAGYGDSSRNHCPYPTRRVSEDSRTRYGSGRHNSSSSYYDDEYAVSKMSSSRSPRGAPDFEKLRAHEDRQELERIRFWPCSGDVL